MLNIIEYATAKNPVAADLASRAFIDSIGLTGVVFIAVAGTAIWAALASKWL